MDAVEIIRDRHGKDHGKKKTFRPVKKSKRWPLLKMLHVIIALLLFGWGMYYVMHIFFIADYDLKIDGVFDFSEQYKGDLLITQGEYIFDLTSAGGNGSNIKVEGGEETLQVHNFTGDVHYGEQLVFKGRCGAIISGKNTMKEVGCAITVKQGVWERKQDMVIERMEGKLRSNILDIHALKGECSIKGFDGLIELGDQGEYQIVTQYTKFMIESPHVRTNVTNVG